MKPYTQLKLAVAVVGLLVWVYGYRVDSSMLRWIGIGLLAVAVVLRLVPKRLRGDDYPET